MAKRSVRGEWLAYYLAELDPDNPQIRRFAKRLGVKRMHAAGMYGAVLGYMWKHQKDGDLQQVDAEDLEYAVDWEGEAGKMHEAFLDIFNDLLWAETWEERTRYHRMPEVVREVERERKAAYRRENETIEGEPSGEPRLPSRDAKPLDAKPENVPDRVPNVSQPPTDQPRDRKTEKTHPPTEIPGVAVLKLRPVGRSVSLKKRPEKTRDHYADRAAELSYSIERRWALIALVLVGLGLDEAEAEKIVVAKQQIAALNKDCEPREEQWRWPIANLIEAIERGPRKKPVADLVQYVNGCKKKPLENYLLRADGLLRMAGAALDADFKMEGES